MRDPAYLGLVDEARTQPWLVVGLGNPGPRYAGNRHNVGAMVVERMAADPGVALRAHKARAAAAEIRLGTLPGGLPGPKVVLAVPSTYMNESGGPVSALMKFFKIPAERLVVIHDELDIDFGAVRLKFGGGEGGHNGLRSISKSIGTKDYLRVRLGIGRPPGRMEVSDFVLKDFSATERRELDFLIHSGAEAVELLVHRGLDDAQNLVHAR
ncbi:aminoacyl-tRNA hydrolase [Dermacoccus sp. GAS27A]|uniref:aminoacyl-tRNA hydrolase n=1 Tax=Dermacoccus sp. GAS27A TaxID=3156270 RepID=UPI00383768C7